MVNLKSPTKENDKIVINVKTANKFESLVNDLVNDTGDSSTHAAGVQNINNAKTDGHTPKQRHDRTDGQKRLWFRGSRHELSNMYDHCKCNHRCVIKAFGKEFDTSEEAFHWKSADYHADNMRIIQIEQARGNPWLAKSIGDEIVTSQAWEEHDKLAVMKQCLTAKYQCCKGYATFLNSTGDKDLRENTSHKYWAGQNRGLNMLGKIHMEIRGNPPKMQGPSTGKKQQSGQVSQGNNNQGRSQGGNRDWSQGRNQGSIHGSSQGTNQGNNQGWWQDNNRASSQCYNQGSNHCGSSQGDTQGSSIQEDVFIIHDSLGKKVRGDLMFHKNSCGTKLLKNRNIKDASDYIDRVDIKSKVITYIVGTNDLSHNNANDVARQSKLLVEKTVNNFPSANIVLYEIPPRKNPDSRWPGFEEKRQAYNTMMSDYADSNTKLTIGKTTITVNEICDDQLHLKYSAAPQLARDIRQSIIPMLGKKTFSSSHSLRLSADSNRELSGQSNNTGHYDTMWSNKRSPVNPTDLYKQKLTESNKGKKETVPVDRDVDTVKPLSEDDDLHRLAAVLLKKILKL